MPKLLLNMRHVPEDEAEEVGEMLDAHGIEHYRTPASIWGISSGGIWLANADDHPRARQLMDVYQAERLQRARAARDQAQRDGTAETLWTSLRADPVKGVLVLLAIVVLVGISTIPFLLMMG
jgi:hypothetical protein